MEMLDLRDTRTDMGVTCASNALDTEGRTHAAASTSRSWKDNRFQTQREASREQITERAGVGGTEGFAMDVETGRRQRGGSERGLGLRFPV